jgi:NADH-quinone oxidoreductase subunit N
MIPNAFDVAQQTLWVLLPEILLLAVAIGMMTAGAFVRLPRRFWWITAVGTVAAAAVVLLRHWDIVTIDVYSAVALNDSLSLYARLALLITGLVLLALAHDQVDDARAAEFFGTLLIILAGAMLVSSANELIFLFVGLELVSIPTYLLLYLPRRNIMTQEAATKYFYLSIFSSALSLYGLAFLYGLAGVSNLKALGYLVRFVPGILQEQFGLIAVVFVMAGLGFRVAAVPFHFYAPDVYQGSPTVVAALLAWVPKAVGFVAMLRVLTSVLAGDNPVAHKAVLLAWIIAAITMTLGNAVALLQEDLKRLLAYSSIAHAGYLMIGVTAAFRNDPASAVSFLGSEGVLFYLVAYALMTLGAFGLIIALSTPERPIETVDDLSGLSLTHPMPALAMALCLFSLAGVPPLAGFWGKFYIFASALTVGSDEETRMFRLLAVVGVLNAAVGAYYYLRIVVVMYLRPASDRPVEARIAWPTAVAVSTCAGLSLLFGLYAQPIARATRAAAVAAIAHPVPAQTATMLKNTSASIELR